MTLNSRLLALAHLQLVNFCRIVYCKPEACGLRAKIEPLHKTNLVQKGRGLTGLDVKFCSIEKWTNQEVNNAVATLRTRLISLNSHRFNLIVS